MSLPTTSSRCVPPEQKALAQEVIRFYEAHHRSKVVTANHFLKTKGITQRSIYGFLRFYHARRCKIFHERKKHKLTKPRAPTVRTPEAQQRLLELMKQDPTVSIREAASILNIDKGSIQKMRKTIMEGGFLSEDGIQEQEASSTSIEQKCEHLGLEEAVPAPTPQPSTSKPKPKIVYPARNECGPSRCLMCYEYVNASESWKKCPSIFSVNGTVGESLNVLFLLLNVLNCSRKDLTNYFEISEGTDPKDWVKVCDNCRDQLHEAMKIKKRIVKLEKLYEKCRKSVIEKILGSSKLRAMKREHSGGLVVTRTIRKEISQREKISHILEIPISGERLERGDQQAKAKALSKRNEVIVKVEVDTEVNGNGHDDNFQFENSSSPLEEADSVEAVANTYSESEHVPDLPAANLITSPVKKPAVPVTVALSKLPLKLSICDLCGEEMRPVGLPLHKLRVHGVVMEGHSEYKCEIEGCDYFTIYKHHLDLHMKKNHNPGRKPKHTCVYCGKGFKTTDKLRLHEEIHKNAKSKPYVCHLCGSSFAVSAYLHVHLTRTHKMKTLPQNVRWWKNKKSTGRPKPHTIIPSIPDASMEVGVSKNDDVTAATVGTANVPDTISNNANLLEVNFLANF